MTRRLVNRVPLWYFLLMGDLPPVSTMRMVLSLLLVWTLILSPPCQSALRLISGCRQLSSYQLPLQLISHHASLPHDASADVILWQHLF